MKKVLLAGLFIFGILINFTFAKEQLFKPENIYKYNLKNLETDLKKDYSSDDCSSFGGKYNNCNIYQLNSTDDKLTKEYIGYLKNGKTDKAEVLLNDNIDKVKDKTFYIYPDIGLVGVIGKSKAYENGIIGLENQGQDMDIKFYYIVTKNNILYKFKSTSSIYFANNKIFIGKSSYKINLQNKSENEYLSDYLQGKEKSKELDEFQNAFKAKIKKLFK